MAKRKEVTEERENLPLFYYLKSIVEEEDVIDESEKIEKLQTE